MKKRTLLPSLALICALGLTGCGVIKDRADRVVVATENSNGARQSAGRLDDEDEALRQIRQFLDLYTDHGQVTREGLAHFIQKYKDKIAPFLAGMNLSAQELIDILFSLDANHDQHLTPQEISQGLMKRIPILRWIPDNQATIDRGELLEQIDREYPRSSMTAHKGLADALMLSDKSWAGGNEDGRLARTEASGAGLVIAVIAQTDFSRGFTLPPGVGGSDPSTGLNLDPVIGNLVRQKLDQQLFARYSDPRASALSEDDRRLEWMQLALKFFSVDHLVHVRGQLPDAQAGSVLAAWGFPQPAHYAQLRKLYGGAMMGGEPDGVYSSIEAFNLLSDLEFARKARNMTQGNFSTQVPGAHPNRAYLLGALTRLVPRTGAKLFLEEDRQGKPMAGIPRAEYWDWINGQFDDPYRGGNGDGKLDDGETAMFLAYAKLNENLYELFDKNHDGWIERSEGNELFKTMGIIDYRIVDAFYADNGLYQNVPSFWTKLKSLARGDRGIRRLDAFGFHIRLIKVLPRIIDKDEGDDQP
jgi:hypothetical protein